MNEEEIIQPIGLEDSKYEDGISFSDSIESILYIYVFYSGNEIYIEIPKMSTVGCLKTMIYAETGIPPCRQKLIGWPEEPLSDSVSLFASNLPRVLYLNLTQMDEYNAIGDQLGAVQMEIVENPQNNTFYVLKIDDKVNKKKFNLLLPGDTMITQVKLYAFILTNIPTRDQIWCGWPENIRDKSKLYELNLDLPCHCLTIQSCNIEEKRPLNNSAVSGSNSETTTSPTQADINSTSESVEGDSAGFAIKEKTLDGSTTSASMSLRSSALIPDNVEGELEGSIHFIDRYNKRYGLSIPIFYSGTLEDAIKEAGFRPAKERRMLVIYLHHDGSIMTNVFCTEVLGLETVLQTLANNFVVWGWDLSNQGNREMFLSSVTRLMGRALSEIVQSISIDLLPVLLIISKSPTNTELFDVIYGNVGIHELLTMLNHSIDIYTEIQETESKKEEERAARKEIILEQDKEYQASLQLDRAKDEAIKQQMLLQSQEEERLKKEQEMEEERRKRERLAVLSELPEEPSDEHQVITFRFRPPQGEMFERKFLLLNKLKEIFDYMLVKGYRIEEYKLISCWPRRELSALDGDTLLQDIGLCARETIILEER